MKLNLGCHNIMRPGYVNIDRVKLPLLNLPEDITFLNIDAMHIDQYFLENSVSEVYASHFFEHLTHAQITELLFRIWGVLRVGGVLDITVPDFYGILTMYKEKHQKGLFSDLDLLHTRVFNVPEDENGHRSIWYKEIGEYYLLREDFFMPPEISHPSEIEIRFITRKKMP